MEVTTDDVNISNINLLAKYLALNAVCHSVDGDEYVNNTAISQMKMNSQEIDTYKMSRNILIIGAGASFNANKHIKLASAFAKDIRNEFIDRNFEKSLELQLDYLVRVNNLKKDEFETIMLACSRLDNEKVLELLNKQYDYKHVPNLFYEIIGHLFKHRFIDIIIDFNFDEMLHNVIEEEMNSMDYNYILFDGDITSEEMKDLMLAHRLKKPIYIKPHGTISHPSSLRFNKEQYYALPAKINELFEQLFIGKYLKKDDKGTMQENFLTLNLITVGFGMQSMDLNYLLETSLDKRQKKIPTKYNLFVFDVVNKKDYVANLPTNITDWFASKNINFVKIDNTKHDLSETLTGYQEGIYNNSLEGLFMNLWHCIKDSFRADSKLLRGISRHVITSLIFQDHECKPLRIFDKKKESDNNYKSQFYLLSRIYVEMAILLINSEGLTNMTQIEESRINKYYIILRKVYKFLESKDKHIIYPDTRLSSFLENFNFKKYKGFVNDTFVYKTNNPTLNINQFKEDIFIQLFEKLEAIKNDFKNQMKSDQIEDDEIDYKIFKVEDKINNIKQILLKEKYFDNLFENPSWIVKPNFDKYKISKFTNVEDKNLLHTDLRFHLQRNYFFHTQKDKWNVVLSSSKRASFINEDSNVSEVLNDADHLVCIVLSQTGERFLDDNLSLKFDPAFGIYEDDKKQFRRLPWWLHNQHLHIFLNFKNEVPQISLNGDTNSDDLNKLFIKNYVGGIYYQRRMLSRKINPIYFGINNIEDAANENNISNIKELIDTFVNYWARGKFYQDQDNDIEESNRSIKDNKEFLTHKLKLFELINRRINEISVQCK